MLQPAPLSKSRFKLALECPTKLYYAGRRKEYRNTNADNDFLKALADGGHQVGALAKYLYHPEPTQAAITVETLDAEQALAETRQRLASPGRVVIAEAAIAHGDCFIRVDILIKDGQNIDLIEVKSKSSSRQEVQKGLKGANWEPYLYDVAFQTVITERAFPGFQVRPKLLVLNTDGISTSGGIYQACKLMPKVKDRNAEVVVDEARLGDRQYLKDLFLEIDVRPDVGRFKIQAVPGVLAPAEHRANLDTYIDWASSVQRSGNRYFGGVSKTCRQCEFRADASDELRSGLHECWALAGEAHQIDLHGETVDKTEPLSIELWGGGGGNISFAQILIDRGRAYLRDVTEEDIPVPTKGDALPDHGGFSSRARRLAQIEAFKGGKPVALQEARLQDMDHWVWPLHMIDFETSAPALPLFEGMSPYETVAFQFSHHVLHKDGPGQFRIEHKTQWIAKDGAFPNFDFVRALRVALVPEGTLHGTVFRYHNHENTVLRKIRHSLLASREKDRDALVSFIELITKPGGDEKADGGDPGPKSMVDLHRLVQEGYYSKAAGGSISLKYILPAILSDAHGVAEQFSAPGSFPSQSVSSLNFTPESNHVWLLPEHGYNPYRTLPPVFSESFKELTPLLHQLAGEDDDGTISQGGVAMTAWNLTQFMEVTPEEKAAIYNSLLRYCELDTLAMAMLVNGLFELRAAMH